MVLVSDGRLVVDEALEHTLVSLRARGVRVHTIRTPSVAGFGMSASKYFTRLDERDWVMKLWPAVRVGYTNSVGQKAEVRLEDDGLLVERKEVSIPAGSGAFDVNFIAPLQRSGYRTCKFCWLPTRPMMYLLITN